MLKAEERWKTIRLHHLGIVVSDIEKYLARSFWLLCSEIVFDPSQKARLCMVGLYPSMAPQIELVQPVGDDSPLMQALKRGGGYHHACFSVPNIELGDLFIQEGRSLPVTDWQPAVLFDGKPVRFFYTRNRELMELVSDN